MLRTVDGASLAVAYGTNAYHRAQDHTGATVRVSAIGPQAGNVVGVIDHTDLFKLLDPVVAPAP